MHTIEYEIKLNDQKRPYVELSENYEDKPVDKFFAIELATYLIKNSFNNNSHVLDDESRNELTKSLEFLLDIGDKMAEIVFDDMKALGELDLYLFKSYHVKVKSLEERNNIDEFVAYNDKIFEKKVGLKVFVEDESTIFILERNNEGEYWEEVCKQEINPPHLQNLKNNPDYYTPKESDLKVGDDIIIGTYASDCHGSPTIRWLETTIEGLPFSQYYSGYVTCRKLIK